MRRSPPQIQTREIVRTLALALRPSPSDPVQHRPHRRPTRQRRPSEGSRCRCLPLIWPYNHRRTSRTRRWSFQKTSLRGSTPSTARRCTSSPRRPPPLLHPPVQPSGCQCRFSVHYCTHAGCKVLILFTADLRSCTVLRLLTFRRLNPLQPSTKAPQETPLCLSRGRITPPSHHTQGTHG